MSATLITCSFRGDLEVCRLLCRSLDRYASAEFEHVLYVPRRDLALFAEFAAPRRRLEPQEGLLPWWLWKAPAPGPKWRRALRFPRRNVYLSPFHAPVRGWIAQQIMKLSASLSAATEIVVHIDSDSALIQPLRLEHLSRGGRTRFYAGPVETHRPGHALWYAAAGRLLGLPAQDYYACEYIAPLVVWRRSLVEAMTRRIAATAGRSWAGALAATPHFSEYVLYGVFVEHALGLEAAALERDANSHSLSRWEGEFTDAADVDRFVADVEIDQLVCCLQSTLALMVDERAGIFNQAARSLEALRPPARAA